MSQDQRKEAKTKKLCDNCIFMMTGSFAIRKMQTTFGFKCENCGRRTSVGSICEISVKKGAAAK